MAAINSHRKRQGYSPRLSNRYNSSLNRAPSGAATMMPDKNTSADTWSVTRRDFADVDTILRRKYLGNTLNVEYTRDPYSGQHSHKDVISTNPGGLANIYNKNNSMLYHYGKTTSGLQVIYASEVSAMHNLLRYSRNSTGVLNNTYHSYKKVNNNYKHVMDIGGTIGGNIKSRATAFKWIGGMWREKK